MKNLLSAARVLAIDLASTILFLAVFLLTENLFLAVGLGMALGVAQIAWQRHRRQPIGTIQWLSVVLILASGTATFLTHDATFVMLKPSIIYSIVGLVMLKRGWMNRYRRPKRRRWRISARCSATSGPASTSRLRCRLSPGPGPPSCRRGACSARSACS